MCIVLHEFDSLSLSLSGGTFLSFGGRMLDNLKLVHASDSQTIYAGGPDGLYMLKPGKHSTLKKVNCFPSISLHYHTHSIY